MTTQQKIAFIRAKCIEANKSIGYRICNAGVKHVGVHTGYCQDGSFFGTEEQKYREVRLSDVLNAIMYTEHIVCIASNERFELFDKASNEWVQQFKTWYLANDDLNAQANETISFIYDMLS